jgi:hypothetical protein
MSDRPHPLLDKVFDISADGADHEYSSSAIHCPNAQSSAARAIFLD